MTKAILASVYALRAQADAVILACEAELGMSREAPVEPGSCPECHASPEDVTRMDTVDGSKKRHCNICRHQWVPTV